jgi:hypothetical protein
MSNRGAEESRRELDRLMQDQVESLKKRTFGGLGDEELRQEEERLKRIREVSADYLAALKRQTERPHSRSTKETQMPDKPNVTLPGKVEKIIEARDWDEPEKAQISVDGADTLYKEIRIENTLTNENGEEVKLKEGADVDVTVEAEKDATVPKKEKNGTRKERRP